MSDDGMHIEIIEDDSEGERVTEEPAQPEDYGDRPEHPPMEGKDIAPLLHNPVMTVEDLMARAIDQGDVATMEKLLAMRKELKAEAARDAFYEDLSKFQATCPEIPKTKPVPNKDGSIRYYYAPLGEIIKTIRKHLRKCGFSYTIHPVEETPEYVIARVAAHHKGGHTETSEFRAPIDPEAYMTAPQKVSSARTFAKRNALSDVFGIASIDEDDDANMLDRIDAMTKYAEKIAEIEKQTDIVLLKKLSRKYYDALTKDEAGQKIILAVFNRKEAALAKEDAAVQKETEDAARS